MKVKVVMSVFLSLGLAATIFSETTADIASRIKQREAQRQRGEFFQHTNNGIGHVKFDHTKNNGRFTISDGKRTFVTTWGGCITDKVYAYKETEGLVGYKEGYAEFPKSAATFEKVMDFSNYVATVNKGDVVLFINPKGDFLAVRLLNVKYVDRGDDEYCVEFEYKIYD